MNSPQYAFLTNDLFDHLAPISANTSPAWGVMNLQEMTEHLADFFDVSSEKLKMKLCTPEEQLPKYKEFLMSDKVFRENTKAPAEVLGDVPQPLRQPSQEAALANLRTAVKNFVDHFQDDPMKLTLHPVFGPLNFEEWVRLHYKHVMHHLRQFGVTPPIVAFT